MTWIEVAHLRLNLKNKTEVKKQKLASLKLAKERHQEKEGALAGYSSANSQLLSVSFFYPNHNYCEPEAGYLADKAGPMTPDR